MEKNDNSTFLKKATRYAVMPEIVPRIKSFNLNFGYFAYLIAYLFSITGIFQPGHPYLNGDNMGRFGVHNVLFEGYKNLIWSWKRVDQIILFGLVSLSFLIIMMQVAILIVSIFAISGSAIAAGVTGGLFATTPPDHDIAFMMLDRVFGVPNIFGSCIEQGIACNSGVALPPIPWPMHDGMHALFQFYSEAMLIVGVLIVFYYFFVIIAETAQTGTPFGQRFASLYAPIRLVLAILLLLPLAHGINTGQYILLHIANMGSSFGTNTWKTFNVGLTNTLGLNSSNMIVKVNSPDVHSLVQFYHLALSCRASYQILHGRNIVPYFEDGTAMSGAFAGAVGSANHLEKKKIRIKYGELGQDTPECGEMVLEISSIDNAYANAVSSAYYNMLISLWNNVDMRAMTEKYTAVHHSSVVPDGAACPAGLWGNATCSGKPSLAYLSALISTTQAGLDASLNTLSTTTIPTYLGFTYEASYLDTGWGGAGIWFNKIASVNGGVVTAVFSKPYVSKMPMIMEHVAKEKLKKSPGTYLFEKYTPKLPPDSKEKIEWPNDGNDQVMASHLAGVHKDFMDENLDPTPKDENKSSAIGLIMAQVFGADGLLDLRENNDVHPLAQMTGLGKSIIESAIQNIFIGLTLSFGAGVASADKTPDGILATSILESKSGLLVTIGTIAMTTGFLLYYVLPFLPFIYFFFAVGKWAKSIFEAMVAVPLWSLAHLKIDGDGISGPAAKNGYFLIFEIFLRPVLTIFGLIAAVAIFTAMAVVMNDLFDLVVGNLSGYDTKATPGTYSAGGGANSFFEIEYFRSGVDQFFFTLLYAVVMYIMATSSFKLIDQIPNSVLRWVGEGVESFGDKADDAAGNLIRYGAIGGGMLGGQLTDGLKQGAKMSGQGVSPFS